MSRVDGRSDMEHKIFAIENFERNGDYGIIKNGTVKKLKIKLAGKYYPVIFDIIFLYT